ncbi:troponin C, skeletal muscle-like [Haliotis cracherodii]|uniref:troponin C-like n=1 Tax=Haliotis rufescens TaxID=6454 RepID=UPI001EAFB18B|nr:troponin C-like [Haliotis rufescens]
MAGAAEEERKFKEMFRILDTRIIGYISCEALQGVLSPMKNEVGLKEEEIKEMIFEEIDKNKDQRITFNEFLKFMTTEDEEEKPEEAT